MRLELPRGLAVRLKNAMGVKILETADDKPKVLERCQEDVVPLDADGRIAPHVEEEYSAEYMHEVHGAL